MTKKYLPAAAGFYTVRRMYDEDGKGYTEKFPVLGWHVEDFGRLDDVFLNPITPNGVEPYSWLLSAGGEVTGAEAFYEDVDNWAAHMDHAENLKQSRLAEKAK